MKRFRCLALALGAWLLIASGAQAHDPGLSRLQVVLGTRDIVATAGFATSDVARTLGDDAPWVAIQIDGAKAALSKSERTAGDENTQFALTFRRPAGDTINIEAPRFAALPPGHRQFLTILDARGEKLAERMLSREEPSFHFLIPAGAPPATAGIGAFFQLGVFHILTGYDHLLFLFALLLVCRTFREALTIITCFTLAHSLTLALAATGSIILPSRVVESAIALSICYVGLENIFTAGKVRWRGVVTFAFGLVHGLGFSSALRDLGFGAHGVTAPLILFNLGVEAGQFAIAALIFPVIRALKNRPVLRRRLVPACSTMVALAGAFWFMQRAFVLF